MLTQQMMHQQLAALGLRRDDTVLIHTSLHALGPVAGGADGVIDAFCSYLSKGLFLVPTHTWASVGPHQPVYDVRTARPCIGALPTAAAFRPDGVRSMNPTHSIWAHGKNAADFVAGEERITTGTAPESCWGRLDAVGAKILLIGVTNQRNTYFHALEERFGVPDRLGELYDTLLIDADGRRIAGRMRPYHCSRCADVSQNFINFERPLTLMGAQTLGRLGCATVRVVDAARAAAVLQRLWAAADYDLCAQRREIPESYYL